MKLKKLTRNYRVDQGEHFRLKDFDPADTGTIKSKEQATAALEQGIDQLRDLQDKLHAQDRWAVLLIFQGMDASGKDSVIKHVMSGVNPQGCQVYSFKQPVGEELNHDYLWRSVQRLPERRRIGIFNGSYYEEVLVVRVHPDLLKNEKLPPALISKRGYDLPHRHAVGSVVCGAGRPQMFSRLVVASAVIDALEGLNLSYPKLDANRSREVARARKRLQQELHR
jgi:polyphosphate kinase 2 (PPK2 family)